MMDYGEIFFDVWRTLGSGILVIIFYGFGKHMANTYSPKWKNYLLVTAAIGFLSLAMWSGYGTHVEDADPLRGGGDIVVDFEPTNDEKNEYGLGMFFKLVIPALIGVYKAKPYILGADDESV